MTDHLVSTYISEMEDRLEAPYRWAIIGNFFVSLAMAAVFGFYLLML